MSNWEISFLIGNDSVVTFVVQGSTAISALNTAAKQFNPPSNSQLTGISMSRLKNNHMVSVLDLEFSTNSIDEALELAMRNVR
jgi:hypothetical protein